MKPEELYQEVMKEYMEKKSNPPIVALEPEIEALINVIAPKLKNLRELKAELVIPTALEVFNRGY